MITEGKKAPAFSMADQNGKPVKLTDYAGKYVVLYFYPRDNTPGCTTEACDCRDEHTKLQKKGAVVLGVSPDSATSHQKFASKFSLPFPLLVDEGHAVAEKYGAWGEKSLYGKKSMGIIRSTFLIGPDGRVERAWYGVRADGHAKRVLDSLA